MPNVSYIVEANTVHYEPFNPNAVITYRASAKLTETTYYSGGLKTNAFNTTIKSHTFENGIGTIEFNDDVISIGGNAFYKCTGLTSITIPNSVTSIGNYAFEECSSLTSIEIPNSVTSIGTQAFNSCSRLTSVAIGNGVTSIDSYAFQSCGRLTNITIGSGLTTIGRQVFSGCTSLPVEGNIRYADIVAVEATNKTLSSYTIKQGTRLIASKAFANCSGLTSITIPNSVTSIGDTAFMNCSGLTTVTIPNTVTSIGLSAFYNCSGLTSITVDSGNIVYDSRDNCNAIIETSTNTLVVGCKNTVISNTVTSIGSETFYGCSGLTSINIPNSVTSIGGYTFSGCSGLTSVTVEATTPPTLGNYAFDSNASGRKIYVPSASVSTYKAASGWSAYASDIEAIPSA